VNEIAQLINRLINDLTALRSVFTNALDDIQRVIEELTGINLSTMRPGGKKGLLNYLNELLEENRRLKEEIEKLKKEKEEKKE